jgi:hypothetical protein
VLDPMLDHEVEADPALFAGTMTRLRQLTLNAVVGNFQAALNGLVDGSLLDRTDPGKGDS